jgi:hypothetical protein
LLVIVSGLLKRLAGENWPHLLVVSSYRPLVHHRLNPVALADQLDVRVGG